MFDKDKSGAIDIKELKDAMKSLGVRLNKKSLRDIMIKVDRDGSGTIDQKEFMSLMAEVMDRRNQVEEFKRAFRIYDDDDTGEVNAKNLKRCADELKEKVTEKEIEAMISQADKDGDGIVNLSDFM